MSWIHYLYSIKTKRIQYLLFIFLPINIKFNEILDLLFVIVDIDRLYITFWKRHIWMIFKGYICAIDNIFITTYRNSCCFINKLVKNNQYFNSLCLRKNKASLIIEAFIE